MDDALFEQVAEAARAMIPSEFGEPRMFRRSWGVKVWFGKTEPQKEHYEAQVIGAKHVDDAEVLAIEIGFHSEHRTEAENEKCLSMLQAAASGWREDLGPEAEAGSFLGRDSWRRISETWPDPDLGEEGLAWEVATRLVDYIVALQPFRGD